MATITKRGDTYRIRASCGYDVNGKQVIRSTTYKPADGMSERQIEKEVNRQAVLFEESCRQGQSLTSAKFETFAREWFKDYAEIKLKRLTIRSYHLMEKRTYEALGHIRVDKISPLDIQKFVRTLVNDGLAPNTVRNYVRFVSVILNYAVKKRVAAYNPCVAVDLPKTREIKHEFYTVDEVKHMFTLFDDEESDKFPFTVFFKLAAYTGCRRGELLGLEWKDIDFDTNVISIRRAYYYSSYEHTCFTDTPKTETSKRKLKLAANAVNALKALKSWQDERREICGGSWVETDKLFVDWQGNSIAPGAANNYLKSFIKRSGMREVNVHSFRHFHASALISEGVDVVTVQKELGHSTPSTTLNSYSHSFSTAQTRAMEAITAVLDF